MALREDKAAIGIALAAIMLASIFATVVPTSMGMVIPATQTITSYGQTFVVNYDQIVVQLEESASAVVVGQNIQFSNTTGAVVGQVTLTGVSGTDTEGEVVFSDSQGRLDTAGLIAGPYNATAAGATKTRINLGTKRGELALRDEANTKDISSITKGSKFRVKFTHSLDSNDGIDLKVSGSANYKQNPADDKVFEDINVSMLSGDNAVISTTDWALGTYTLHIETNEQYARGLALTTNEETLEVISGEIAISADKTEVVKGERVEITVTGVAGDSITMTAEDGEFPVGEYDNNLATAADTFDHTIDADGVRTYIVKFTDTGSKKVKVTVTAGDQAGKDADVSITVVKRKVVFDVPSTAVVGEKVDIKGSVNAGIDVDIVIEDAGKVFNDEPVDKNKEFSVEWDTAKLTIGSYKIEAFVDSALSTLSQYMGVDEDGSATIQLIPPSLTAAQPRNIVAEDDVYTIEGTATGVDNVDVVFIGPKGTSVSTVIDVADGLYITSVSVTDDEFIDDILMGGMGFDTGSWIVVVLSPGRDGTYGNLGVGAGELRDAFGSGGGQINLQGKDQAQILVIIQDATVNVAGSDDLLVPLSFRIESAYVRLDPVEPVVVGEPLNISGVTNRKPGTKITISTLAGPTDLLALAEVEWPTADEGVFNATINTTYAELGTYTLEADDGAGNTANVTIEIEAPFYHVELTVEGAETASKIIYATESATYTLTVKNRGTMPDNYTLTVENVNNADTAKLSTDAITNLAREAMQNISLTVTDTAVGTYLVNATVKSDMDPTNATAMISTTTMVNVAPSPTPTLIVRRGGGGGAPRDSDRDGYSDFQELILGTDPKNPKDYPGKPEATPTPTPTPTPTVTPSVPPPAAPPTPPPTPTPATPTPEEAEPGFEYPILGFEAVFAVAGLLALAYVVLRRKR